MSDDEPVSELAVKTAIQKRADYLVANLATCTMKQCRRLLEKDLNLPATALDSFKAMVSDEVDRVVRSHKSMAAREAASAKKAAGRSTSTAGEGAPKPTKKAGSGEKKRKASREEQPAERIKPAKSAVSKPQKKQKPPVVAKTTSLGVLKKLEKMKSICAMAGIKISPTLYKVNKSNEERVSALRELLDKHGLTSKSLRADCQIVKQRLEKERDLEGIDMGNIVSGGRRSRTGNAASVNYKAMGGEDSDDEDDGEDDRRKSKSAADSGSASGTDCSEGDVSDDGAGSDGSESGDENAQPEAAKPSAKKSPGTGRADAHKASQVPVKKAELPARPKITAAVDEDLDAASSDEATSGDSASNSDHDGDAVKERDATAQRDDNNAVQTSSEDDDSPAVQARTKRAVAIVESDDDESLDLD